MKNNEVLVVIPTYNAKDGIIETISGIRTEVSGARIIVVDDNSPDGTADLIKTHFKGITGINVLIRKQKGGRGSAVIAGFRQGLKYKEVNYFIEMDSDLCHDPKYIREMVTKCETADLVIVSKYLTKSTISGLGFRRRILSRLMNFGARLILQVPVSDFSNGYRCYTRKVAEFLTKTKFKSRGFVVLSEIIFLCHKKGFRFIEIPFDFKFQKVSKSNLNFMEMREAFITLLRLRLGM